ncbi:MAG: methylated-DNA--[protein]-cysteine S-methyltransferase [Sutterellaceae bacterium]|nr:methylated-DNA--[protein]-cysteine S-methyltransferase [Sutterellaceae bacterium]
MTVYTNTFHSPIGNIVLASNGSELTGLWFEGQKYFGSTLAPESEVKDLPIFTDAFLWLETYFAGKDPGRIPALALNGSSFRRAVWDILISIPYGQTVTYGEIARRLAKDRGVTTMSAQAVGGAVGHNPISIIVPCHRVVGTGGSLTGYAGGIDKKVRLLELEGVDMRCFSVPTKGTAI